MKKYYITLLLSLVIATPVATKAVAPRLLSNESVEKIRSWLKETSRKVPRIGLPAIKKSEEKKLHEKVVLTPEAMALETTIDPQLFQMAKRYASLVNSGYDFKANIDQTKSNFMALGAPIGMTLGIILGIIIYAAILAKTNYKPSNIDIAISDVGASLFAGAGVGIGIGAGLATFWAKWKTGLIKINSVIKKYTSLEPLEFSAPEFALIVSAYKKNVKDVALIAAMIKPFIAKPGVMQALAALIYGDPLIGKVNNEYVLKLQKMIDAERPYAEKIKKLIAYVPDYR